MEHAFAEWLGQLLMGKPASSTCEALSTTSTCIRSAVRSQEFTRSASRLAYLAQSCQRWHSGSERLQGQFAQLLLPPYGPCIRHLAEPGHKGRTHMHSHAASTAGPRKLWARTVQARHERVVVHGVKHHAQAQSVQGQHHGAVLSYPAYCARLRLVTTAHVQTAARLHFATTVSGRKA